MQISLTTTGRRSGTARAVTLYAWEDRDALLVVGSWGGAARDPDWVGNLRADPHATILRGRSAQPVVARELDGEEHARGWELVVARFPLYATYQDRTTRRIPLFALTPEAPPQVS
jgi:deazaflavin-dependent oxidoreductase (nitroreductase family)